MNDLELERMGRRAGASTLAEAAAIADSEAALAELRASATGATRLHPTPDAPPEDSHRPMWVVFAAAAAIVAVVAAVAVVNRGDDAAPAVSTDPTLAAVPPVDETVPTVDEEPANTVATTEPAIVPAPTTGAPVDPVEEVTQIADEIGATPERRVLATYTVGDGDGQLGLEDCQECEPLRPWAPVVMNDGTVIVADAVNQRWQVFRDGAWSAVPYADGMPIVGSPVVGPDGLIYALRADGLGQGNPRHVAALDPVTLDLVAKHDGGPPGYWSVDLVNGQIEVGGETVVEFDHLLGRPTWEIDWDRNRIAIAISGVRREFQLPETWHPRHDAVAALDDGSVVLQITSVPDDTPNADSTAQPLLLHLWADGTSATSALPASPLTNNLDVAFTPTGLVQLEDGEIAEYTYPQFAGPDPLAEWTIPDATTSSLDQVPRLMPSPLPDAVDTLVRSDFGGGTDSPYSFQQVWVRTDAAGAVDGSVEVITRLDPQLLGPSDADVDLPGWLRAYFVRTEAPFESLTAHTATRTMVVSTSGLSRDDVVAIAAGFTTDADGAGWSAPALSTDAGWTLLADGWNTYGASRGIVGRGADDRIVVHWSASSDTPGMVTGPGFYGAEVELVEVDGRPALLFDAGHATAITWSPEQDLVVMVGSEGSAEELLAIAQSMEPVDQATWDAIPLLESDGCWSLFC